MDSPPPLQFREEPVLPVTPSLRRLQSLRKALSSCAAVRLLVGEQSPDDPLILVRHRHARFRCSQSSLFIRNPAAPAVGLRHAAVYNGASAMNKQHAKVRIAALGNAEQPL